MKLIQYLFLLSIWFTIFSCSKYVGLLEEVYQSGYHKTGIYATGNPRLFALNGEITDKSIVSRFDDADSSNFSYRAKYISEGAYYMDSIRFSDSRHAILTNNQQAVNCMVNMRFGWSFLITRIDTSLGYSNNNEFSHHIDYYIGGEKPDIYSEFLISSTRGAYLFGYQTKEKFLFNSDFSRDRLLAPILIYHFIPGNSSTTGSILAAKNNNLQEDFYKDLSEGDTVLVRTYFMTYEK